MANATNGMVYIRNDSFDKNVRIYARGSNISGNTFYSKNIFVNKSLGMSGNSQGEGEYYYTLTRNNYKTLILYPDREVNGWINITPI